MSKTLFNIVKAILQKHIETFSETDSILSLIELLKTTDNMVEDKSWSWLVH